MAINRGAYQHCGLVLKKLDFTDPPNYDPTPTFYANLPALVDAVKVVQNALTDSTASGPPCDLINDILTFAAIDGVYFSGNNPARTDFLKDWNRVKQLAGCP